MEVVANADVSDDDNDESGDARTGEVGVGWSNDSEKEGANELSNDDDVKLVSDELREDERVEEDEDSVDENNEGDVMPTDDDREREEGNIDDDDDKEDVVAFVEEEDDDAAVAMVEVAVAGVGGAGSPFLSVATRPCPHPILRLGSDDAGDDSAVMPDDDPNDVDVGVVGVAVRARESTAPPDDSRRLLGFAGVSWSSGEMPVEDRDDFAFVGEE
jgi:hypothetical protein